MPSLAVAVGLSIAGNIGGLLIASILLLFGDRLRTRLVPWLISYAVGTLLGIALLGLLPEALAKTGAPAVLGTLLAGILTFFMLEKLVLWRHCHTTGCEVHDASAASLVLLGGALHNIADGAVIGAAVLTSIPLGISTALAVAAHQIPQEVGDFAILLSAGYTRGRAFALNLLSGLAGIVGAVGVYVAAGPAPQALPYVLAFAAGSFLYVAMSDLIPDLHRGTFEPSAIGQIVVMSAGIGTILLL